MLVPLLHIGKKLYDRSIKGIFLGFPQNTKGYIILNLKFHSFEISRHVIFHENHFPYKLDGGLPRDHNTLFHPISNAYNSAFDIFSDIAPLVEPCASTPAPNIVPPPASLSSDLSANNVSAPASNIAPPPELSPPAPQGSTSPQFPRRSTRPHRKPAYLADFHTATNTVSSRYPIHNYLSYNSLSSNFRNIIFSINSHHEPQTYNEASKHAYWQFAMQDELQALAANKTWQLTHLPPGKKTIMSI